MKENKLYNGNHPFKNEEDYFDKFESNLLAKITGKTYHLPLGLNHPFTAPSGYFEKLEVIVLQKTAEVTGNQSNPFVKIWKSNNVALRAAAAVFLISVIGFAVLKQNQTPAFNQNTLAELETDAIVDYLENEPLSFSDLAVAVEGSDFSEVGSFISEDHLNDLKEEDLLQFIDIQYFKDI